MTTDDAAEQHLHALTSIRDDIDAKRAELAELYARRTQVAAAAVAAGISRATVGKSLGVVRPAVNKILAGQDGMPARAGYRY